MTVDDQVRAQLDRILAHESFSGADRRTRLLRFLVEQSLAGQAEALKESVIAVEVFDRPTAHDPGQSRSNRHYNDPSRQDPGPTRPNGPFISASLAFEPFKAADSAGAPSRRLRPTTRPPSTPTAPSPRPTRRRSASAGTAAPVRCPA